MLKTTRFDAADFLQTEKKQSAYITAALETGDADFVRDALGIVAKARGMGQVAKTAALNRGSLYWRDGQSRVQHGNACDARPRSYIGCSPCGAKAFS